MSGPLAFAPQSFRIGLNPYGIAYSVGLFSTPERRNPQPLGLSGFLDLADKIGACGVELPCALLKDVPDSEVERAKARLHAPNHYAIMMHGIPWGDLDGALACARRFDFTTVRMHLTSILCGARSKLAAQWPVLYKESVAALVQFSKQAADVGIDITLEDHQDLTSCELLEICERCGSNAGICFDTGNPFSVGEDPVEFARAVASRIRHLHLKDYRIHWTGEGYRLARCAIGAGAVDFAGIAAVFDGMNLPASIECGALTERHVRLLCNDWWEFYPARCDAFLSALRTASARRAPDSMDWCTPWDRGASPDEIVAYEMRELEESVAFLSRPRAAV